MNIEAVTVDTINALPYDEKWRLLYERKVWMQQERAKDKQEQFRQAQREYRKTFKYTSWRAKRYHERSSAFNDGDCKAKTAFKWMFSKEWAVAQVLQPRWKRRHEAHE